MENKPRDQKAIPFQKLDSFEKAYIDPATRIPDRHQEQVDRSAISYFSIFLRTEHPCKTTIDINRSEFYKILLITGGSGDLTYGTTKYEICPGTLLLLKPSEVRSWKATAGIQEGYYCIFTDLFYAISEVHLNDLRYSQFFTAGSSPVLVLNAEQLKTITPLFEKLFNEFTEQDCYNADLIKMYLHILVMEAGRVAGQLPDDMPGQKVSSNLTNKFLALLEDEYATGGDLSIQRSRFPSDFAGKLYVHPNHLNASVKTASGKTVSEHIHARLLAEAQLLLAHTDLTIAEISFKLGFKEPTHFCSYFKKSLNTTPVQYKRSIVS